MYKFSREGKFSFLWDKYSRVPLGSPIVIACLIYKKLLEFFLQCESYIFDMLCDYFSK